MLDTGGWPHAYDREPSGTRADQCIRGRPGLVHLPCRQQYRHLLQHRIPHRRARSVSDAMLLLIAFYWLA